MIDNRQSHIAMQLGLYVQNAQPNFRLKFNTFIYAGHLSLKPG